MNSRVLRAIGYFLFAVLTLMISTSTVLAQADTTPPRLLSITRFDPASEFTNSTLMTFQYTFSEGVTGFSGFSRGLDVEFDFVSESSGRSVEISPSIYHVTVNIRPKQDTGTVSQIVFPSSTVTDLAGNQMVDSSISGASEQYTYDVRKPTVVIGATTSNPTNASPIPVAFTFSKDVTGFSAADISVSGGTATGLSGSGANYTANITPSGNGTVTVNLPANVAEDNAGNGNIAATQFSIVSERTPPSVVITSSESSPTNAALIPVTFTFSKAVTGFSAGDVNVGNGVLSNFAGTGAVYTANVTSVSDGAMTVNVPAGVAQDSVANRNTAAAQFSIENDRNGPSVVISGMPVVVTAPFVATITFNEDVIGFAIGDIMVGNGTASGFSIASPSSYTALITPDGDGPLTVSVAANVASDALTNGNAASNVASGNADITDPTVTISGTAAFPGTPYTLTISFSEDITDLALTDFTTNNVSLSGLAGSGGTYTVQATASDFNQSVQLPAATVADLSGRSNLASNIFAVTPDDGSPTLTITGIPDQFEPGDTFNATFTFSENVVDFEASDIAVSNGSLGVLSGGPAIFTATVTPDSNASVTLAVAEGAANDISGAPSTAASVTAAINTASTESEIIAGFLENRARSLVQNQPGLISFINGKRQGAANAVITRGNGDFTFHSSGQGPVWFSLNGSWSESDTEKLSYGLAVIGSHWKLDSGAIVGAMLQYDTAEQTNTSGATIKGQGWLVGPYFATQIGQQPFYLEGRVLYGQTANEISPFGTTAVDFSGERLLATLDVEGRIEMQRGWFVTPNLTFSHVNETQNAYTNSASNLVPEQSIQLNEVDLGFDIEVPVAIEQGELWLDWGVSGIYSQVNGSGAASAYVPNEENGRARLDFGLRYNNGSRLTSFGSAFVDGLGSQGSLRTYGVEFGFRIAL